MNDFISIIVKESKWTPENLISSKCIYHTESNGCTKHFIPCPVYIEDEGLCLGCGGCGFEYDEETMKKMEELNEKNKK